MTNDDAVADLTVCTGMPTPFCMSLYTMNKLLNGKQTRFHYITVALAFWCCRATADADAAAVAVADLTVCSYMPTPCGISLYTKYKLCNGKYTRFCYVTVQPLALAFW
jgi:hypothetical protein